MLRDVYLAVGLGWTLALGALALLTVVSWFVAMAGVVVRPMRSRSRALLLALLTVLPPSAIVVLGRFVAVSRAEYRSKAILERTGSASDAMTVVLPRRPLKAVA